VVLARSLVLTDGLGVEHSAAALGENDEAEDLLAVGRPDGRVDHRAVTRRLHDATGELIAAREGDRVHAGERPVEFSARPAHR